MWSDGRETGDPYDVVVDGRTLSWEEFGRALGAYEGWRFRMVIEDRCEDVRPDAEVISLGVSPTEPTEEGGRSAERPVTIDAVLSVFLADQEARLATRTLRNYLDVIGLFRDCLNGYGHQSLDPAERRRFEAAYEHDEDAFVHLFGPDKIVENLGEFLGYFMIRKVAAGEELLRSAGTVTKKLVKWLGEHGYLDAAAVDDAVAMIGDAARDLPKADKLSQLLFDQARTTTIDLDKLGDDDYMEDYLMIEAVEPGALWFEGAVGPVKVPRAASGIAQVGWTVNVVLGRAGKTWHLLEVGNVYP